MSESKSSRVLDVGWLLDPVKAEMIWAAPKAVDLPTLEHASAKAVTACPAVLQHEARLFEIACPIDVQLSLHRQGDRWMFSNDMGKDSAINTEYLQNMLVLMPEDQWRHPKRPVVQIHTPYRFVADDYCYINKFPPFHDYKGVRWPGTVIGGRFQLDVWPRKLMWAFEWHDTSAPLVLKRGEPWFYLRFEGRDPAMNTRMMQAQWTPELEDYVRGIEEVTNYVNKTLSLFKTAQERRPESLLKKK